MKAEAAHGKAWQLVGTEAKLETLQPGPLTTMLSCLQMNVQFQYEGCYLGEVHRPAAPSPSCPWRSQLPPPRATLPTPHPDGWTPTLGQATLGPPLLSPDLPDPLANSRVPMALQSLTVCHPGASKLPRSGFCRLGVCCCVRSRSSQV